MPQSVSQMPPFFANEDNTVHYQLPPQVYYEGVNVDDEIPSVDFNLTVQRMIMFVGATRNYPGLHHNDRVAQANGAERMFLQNNSCLMLWERVVSDWMGVYSRVKSATFRITNMSPGSAPVSNAGSTRESQQEITRALGF